MSRFINLLKAFDYLNSDKYRGRLAKDDFANFSISWHRLLQVNPKLDAPFRVQ